MLCDATFCRSTGRVSTEFRQHGIPRNFLTSEVISAQFRRNSAKFRGISPELRRKSLPYSAECQNVTSVDTLSTGTNKSKKGECPTRSEKHESSSSVPDPGSGAFLTPGSLSFFVNLLRKISLPVPK